jgi:hypothetical protein
MPIAKYIKGYEARLLELFLNCAAEGMSFDGGDLEFRWEEATGKKAELEPRESR